MVNRIFPRLSILLALAAVLTASPVVAQGKGNGRDKAKQSDVRKSKGEKRPELQRRDRDDRDDRRTESRRRDEDHDDRYDDRYENARSGDRYGNGRSKQAGVPAFCRSGQGHPVHGRRWCQDRGYGVGTGANNDRYGQGTYGRSGRSGSYEDSHAELHRYLDRKYSDLADDRPLDPMYQIRIRRERSAEHDRWHAEMGRRHD